MFIILLTASDYALLIARIFFGTIFVKSGISKLKDINKTAKDYNKIGIRPGIFWGTIIAALETFGGFAILIGLQTQVFALLLALVMTVAVLWDIKNKKEYALHTALVIIGLILATSGSYLYALDSLFIGPTF